MSLLLSTACLRHKSPVLFYILLSGNLSPIRYDFLWFFCEPLLFLVSKVTIEHYLLMHDRIRTHAYLRLSQLGGLDIGVRLISGWGGGRQPYAAPIGKYYKITDENKPSTDFWTKVWEGKVKHRTNRQLFKNNCLHTLGVYTVVTSQYLRLNKHCILLSYLEDQALLVLQVTARQRSSRSSRKRHTSFWRQCGRD